MDTDYKQYKFSLGTEEIIERWINEGLVVTISLEKIPSDKIHEYKGTAFSNKLRKSTYVYTRLSMMNVIDNLEL